MQGERDELSGVRRLYTVAVQLRKTAGARAAIIQLINLDRERHPVMGAVINIVLPTLNIQRIKSCLLASPKCHDRPGNFHKDFCDHDAAYSVRTVDVHDIDADCETCTKFSVHQRVMWEFQTPHELIQTLDTVSPPPRVVQQRREWQIRPVATAIYANLMPIIVRWASPAHRLLLSIRLRK